MSWFLTLKNIPPGLALIKLKIPISLYCQIQWSYFSVKKSHLPRMLRFPLVLDTLYNLISTNSFFGTSASAAMDQRDFVHFLKRLKSDILLTCVVLCMVLKNINHFTWCDRILLQVDDEWFFYDVTFFLGKIGHRSVNKTDSTFDECVQHQMV